MDIAAVYVFVLLSFFQAEEQAKTADKKIAVLQKEISVLIEKFEDRRFAMRQQAYERLVKIVQEDESMVFLPFLKEAVQHKNNETARRIRAAVSYYYFVMPDNYSSMPWIDMLPEDFPDRENIIQKYLNKSPPFSDYGCDCPQYRCATILFIYDLLDDKKITRSKAIQLLNIMAENEKQHNVKFGCE